MLVQVIRYLVVLTSGFLAGSRTVDAARSWVAWRHWMVPDPPAADAYRTFFLESMSMALLSLAIAGLVWWLLRPRSRVRGAG